MTDDAPATPLGATVAAPDASGPAAGTGSSAARRWLLFGLRLAVTGGLIAWVLTGSDLEQVVAQLAQVDVAVWLAGLLVAVAAQALQVVNLRWALHRVNDAVADAAEDRDAGAGSSGGKGVRVPVGTATRAHALGVFANLFLPSAIGGDVLKSVALRRTTSGVMAAASAVILARALGVMGLVLIAGVGLAVTWPTLTTQPGLAPGVATVLGSLFAVMAVGWVARRPFARLGRRLCPARLRPKITPVFDTVDRLTLPAVLLPVAVGTAYSVCAATWCGLFGVALGLELTPQTYAFAVPTVYLVTLLPITVQGIGLREATYVQVLAVFGVGVNPALVFAWLVFSAPLFVGLACGVFVAVTRPAGDP